ncbi:MAG: potassium transporter TrkG [Ardenticatenaceae bacterium]|nr:potassium transporter TrkG [Ardenticatenaceae bacterium]
MSRQSLWRRRAGQVLAYHGPVLTAVGLALLVPLIAAAVEAGGLPPAIELRGFLIPAVVAAASGQLLLRTFRGSSQLSPTDALLVTTGVWLSTSLLGAVPYVLILNTPPINALHESISGFTTAGTTMLTGLDQMPRSIIVWRALTQWLGGLGILLIILLVGRSRGNPAFSLLSAEGVKVSSGRLSFNFRQAAVLFLLIYLILTGAQVLLTTLLGMPLFDSVMHAMTTISTGGFSPHDESIAFYRNRPDQFPLFAIMEGVIIIFMMAGGINFYVLFRLGRGDLRALWDGLEMRLLWLVFGSATLITAASGWLILGGTPLDWLHRSGFEIASLISTTGYELTATGDFPRLSLELFLLLMILGGCAGSTAGGIKLIRLGLLGKFLSYEIRQLRLPPHAVHVPTLNGTPISADAFRQAVFIVLLWLVYVGTGGWLISLMAPDLGIAQAYSTVFTAIGVFGPSFISVSEVIALPEAAKIIFMIGMLAGRLEILPLLVFFNPIAWRS